MPTALAIVNELYVIIAIIAYNVYFIFAPAVEAADWSFNVFLNDIYVVPSINTINNIYKQQ